MKLSIGWQHYRVIGAGAPDRRLRNSGRGYFKFAYYLHRALRALEGVRVVDAGQLEPAHPRLALHLCPPHAYRPIPGKRNVVFSMHEGDALSDEDVERLQAAEARLVPSAYCEAVWRAHGLSARVVPLGVADELLEGDASRPVLTPRRLRFLWLGSKHERKGWPLLGPAWELSGASQRDDAELYIKTVGDGSVQRHGNVTIDQRDLEELELGELYRSADAFLFPSLGEGFGLPALEAMASGCLVVAPEASGLTEFVSSSTACVIEPGPSVRVQYGGEYIGRPPTAETVAAQVERVLAGWGTPALEGIRSRGVEWSRGFTWAASARELRDHLVDIVERNEADRLVAV